MITLNVTKVSRCLVFKIIRLCLLITMKTGTFVNFRGLLYNPSLNNLAASKPENFYTLNIPLKPTL